MINLKVIALIGMPGAGKEEFVKVAKAYDFPIVRMGDLVRTEVQKKGLKLRPSIVSDIANAERAKYGDNIWGRRTIRVVKKLRTKAPLTVIDGIRSNAELHAFRDVFGLDLIPVGIHASPKTRWQRILNRKRKDDTLTLDQFHARDARELNWGIAEAIALADYIIVNEGTLDEFTEKVQQLLKRVV